MRDSFGIERLCRETPEPDYELIFIDDEKPRGRRLTPEEIASGSSPEDDD
jgi:hypothetical protein